MIPFDLAQCVFPLPCRPRFEQAGDDTLALIKMSNLFFTSDLKLYLNFLLNVVFRDKIGKKDYIFHEIDNSTPHFKYDFQLTSKNGIYQIRMEW